MRALVFLFTTLTISTTLGCEGLLYNAIVKQDKEQKEESKLTDEAHDRYSENEAQMKHLETTYRIDLSLGRGFNTIFKAFNFYAENYSSGQLQDIRTRLNIVIANVNRREAISKRPGVFIVKYSFEDTYRNNAKQILEKIDASANAKTGQLHEPTFFEKAAAKLTSSTNTEAVDAAEEVIKNN